MINSSGLVSPLDSDVLDGNFYSLGQLGPVRDLDLLFSRLSPLGRRAITGSEGCNFARKLTVASGQKHNMKNVLEVVIKSLTVVLR